MKVHHLTGPAPLYTNSFVVISEQGSAVIIDPACPLNAYRTVLQQANATLKLILCTHGHFDHVGTAEALRRETGAPVRCGVQDVLGHQFFPLTAVDGGYADGEEIAVDELTFRVVTTPGHTLGGVCLLCGDHFFTGDTLFCGDTGRTDLPGGSHETMVQTMRKLQALRLPADTKVLPGHDIFTTYGEQMAHNEFIRMYCPAEEA